MAHAKNTHGYTEPIKQRTVHLQSSKDRDKTAQVHLHYFIVILVKKYIIIIMDSWLKTGRLASGKNDSACSPAEYNENISEEDVSSLSVRILNYLPIVIKP